MEHSEAEHFHQLSDLHTSVVQSFKKNQNQKDNDDNGSTSTTKKIKLDHNEPLLLFCHVDSVEKHKTGLHQEGCDRVTALLKSITQNKTICSTGLDLIVSQNIPIISNDMLLKVHSSSYLEALENIIEEIPIESGDDIPRPLSPKLIQFQNPTLYRATIEKGESFPSMTQFSSGSLIAAKRASGAVVEAIQKVFDPCVAARRAFCIVRPPGHHSCVSGYDSHAEGCGFCILNHACVGAAFASLELKKKVVIIDFDVHHGNGTEDIIKRKLKDNVYYISIHLAELFENKDYDYFPGTGVEDVNTNITNIPIVPLWDTSKSESFNNILKKKPRHTEKGRLGFRKLFSKIGMKKLREITPDLVLLSAGFDGAKGDVGNLMEGQIGLDLLPMDYHWMVNEIQTHCSTVVSILEGGYGSWDEQRERYDRTIFAQCAVAHCLALQNKPYTSM